MTDEDWVYTKGLTGPALCADLGTSASIASNLANQAVNHYRLNEFLEARAKWCAALTIFTDLAMPRARDIVQRNLDDLNRDHPPGGATT